MECSVQSTYNVLACYICTRHMLNTLYFFEVRGKSYIYLYILHNKYTYFKLQMLACTVTWFQLRLKHESHKNTGI